MTEGVLPGGSQPVSNAASVMSVLTCVKKKKKKNIPVLSLCFLFLRLLVFFNLVYWFCISMLLFLLKAACSFELKIYSFLCHIKCFL